jgi:hypothetical protein
MMAKKPKPPESPAGGAAAQTLPDPLSREQRAARVLISQGRAAGMLEAMGPERIAQLAAWTAADGTILPSRTVTVTDCDGTRDEELPVGVGVQMILVEFWNFLEDQKATVDADDRGESPEDPTPPAA